MNELKVFTAVEATQLIPALRTLLRHLQTQRGSLIAKEVEIDALELIAGEGSSSSESVAEKMQAYQQEAKAFYELLDQLSQMGCHLKSLEMGLVDFYGFHEGRLVFLCWQMEEGEVTHWHEIGGGYDNRQPLLGER